MGSKGWDVFCAALDGKFEESSAIGVEAYDPQTNMVAIEGDLTVPLPVYNYAQYIKKASYILSLLLRYHR